MLEKLETCKNLGLSDWQNSVGVDLLTSAKKKKLSEHDHLVCSSSKDRFSAYEREAFLCFKESMKLGSAKGAYNLGICFEQGIGTSVDLGKVNNVRVAFLFKMEVNDCFRHIIRPQHAMKRLLHNIMLLPSTT